MEALPLLEKPNDIARQPVFVLSGDEDFLRRRVRDAIVQSLLGDADPELALSVYQGDKFDFSTIRNDLETLPFLSDCRIVIIETADTFVTENRPALEKYVAKPATVNVLILEVKSFPATTNLYKALPDTAKVVCKSLAPQRLPSWCVSWARTRYKKKLASDASQLLVERVGAAMGLLDQEIGKLAMSLGNTKTGIEFADVDRLISRSREANVFTIMDAVGDGKPAAALAILEHLFTDGENPMGVLAPLSWQLRQLASVGRLLARGEGLSSAMEAVGIKPWSRSSVERQVRHLGLRRLEALSNWLLEIDLGLKGGSVRYLIGFKSKG